MACIWDQIGWVQQRILENQFSNFADLAKRLQCPSNPDQNAIAAKLQDRVGTNMDLLGRLNNGLSDPAVRERIVKIYNEEPAALNAAVDRIIDNPEQTADIIRGIQLKSEQPAPQPQAAPAPAPPKIQKPPVAAKPESTTPHVARHHIENADNARLQAQMHVMGVYKGDINGAENDTKAALKEYAKNHPELKIQVTDKDLTADQLKAVKDAVAADFDKWSHDKTNAQHLKDTIKAGYDTGYMKPDNPAAREMQIAALALGGTLPRFGVDGVRGPETNKALREIMGPEGRLTKILDDAGIPHEWPSAAPPQETPAKPAATSATVRNGETAVVTNYFNRRSDGDIDPAIVYNPDQRTPGRQYTLVA